MSLIIALGFFPDVFTKIPYKEERVRFTMDLNVEEKLKLRENGNRLA